MSQGISLKIWYLKEESNAEFSYKTLECDVLFVCVSKLLYPEQRNTPASEACGDSAMANR